MELLQEYKNGNYTVKIYSDGTKELVTDDDEFIADFPDSMDIKITNRCDLMCPMCHEASSPDGAHAVLDAEFLDALHAGTELAIGGGNPLSHPGLRPFLEKLKSRGVIANITVNEKHLRVYREFIERLLSEKLIYGLGISVSEFKDETFEFAKTHPNAVLHVIAGITDPDELLKRASPDLKLLILGYKRHGRGKDYFSVETLNNIVKFGRCLNKIMREYGVVSFDNLALGQLKLKYRVPKCVWNERYMGDDGQNTMYVDLVKNEFAVSSVSDKRYPILPTAEQMLAVIKSEK